MKKRRKRKKQPAGPQKAPAGDSQKRKLYEAMLSIYNFFRLEDLLLLKSESFLKLCGLADIDWNFSESRLKKEAPRPAPQKSWPFKLSCPLSHKTDHYGELIFQSSQKLPQSQKRFLKKIADFVSNAIHFIEDKKRMENIKRHWSLAFDSFPQAFCVTDKNLKIIRFNKFFQKISGANKKDSSEKSLLEICPIPLKMPTTRDKAETWLAQGSAKGQAMSWEISFKPLFLKREKAQAFLFLIKDVTKEMEMEAKLSAKAKEREIGLIKGSVAHELNNPIAGIKALLSLIEGQVSPKQAQIKDSLKEMQKAIGLCQKLVQQILFVSQTPRPSPPSAQGEAKERGEDCPKKSQAFSLS